LRRIFIGEGTSSLEEKSVKVAEASAHALEANAEVRRDLQEIRRLEGSWKRKKKE
jgi:hypothetical protein